MKNVDELLKTCDGIEALNSTESDAFHMGLWRRERPACGTSACFIDWLPTFNPNSKIELRKYSRGPGSEKEFYPAFGEPDNGYTGSEFIFKNLAEHFGITYDEAASLFSPQPDHNSPKEVVKNIRAFVKKKMKEELEEIKAKKKVKEPELKYMGE